MTKACKDCGIEKSRSEFYGRSARCKICANDRARQAYASDRDAILAAKRSAWHRRPAIVRAAAERRAREEAAERLAQDGLRQCAGCLTPRPIGDFQRRRAIRDGIDTRCRACRNALGRAEWAKHRDARLRERREWYRANVDAAKAAMRESYRRNRTQRVAQQAAYNRANRDRINDFMLKKTHGITREEYDALAKLQDGGCAICGSIETTRATTGEVRKRLAVDHDHRTGRLRGLLCSRCNVGLGMFQDSEARLQAAIDYLRRAELGERIDDLVQHGERKNQEPQPSPGQTGRSEAVTR